MSARSLGKLNGKRLPNLLARSWPKISSQFPLQRLRGRGRATKWVAPKASNLNKLFTQNYASVSNSSTSAAMQLAVWEIIHGDSRAHTTSRWACNVRYGCCRTQHRNSWLHDLGSFAGPITYSIDALVSPSRQDLMVITRGPQPEGLRPRLCRCGDVVFLAGAVAAGARPAEGAIRSEDMGGGGSPPTFLCSARREPVVTTATSATQVRLPLARR